MREKESAEDFYKRFKKIVEESHDLPGEYTFKFIVASNEKLIAQVFKVFDLAEPQFIMKESKNKKYTSITVQMFLLDADSVIGYYQEIGKIEGVIML